MLAKLLPVFAFRALSFLAWALMAASLAYWALKLWATPIPTTAAAVAESGLQTDPALVARALGATKYEAPVAPIAETSSRFSLKGVVVGTQNRGVALIAVEGKPPRPVRVGGKVDEGVVLQSVERRRAILASTMQGPPMLMLELPSNDNPN